MNTKAIIFDLDGTAIPNTPNGMPSSRLVKAIQAASPSLILCAATGRPITNAKSILDALQLKHPCVISAGTQIADPVSGEILWEAAIDKSDAEAIIEVCKPYHYELLVGNELMGEGSAAREKQVTGSVNVMYLMGCAEADAQIILQKLGEISGITAAGVTSWTHEGIDIHITHREATKEHAIAELLKMLDITKEDAVGIGDANNDVHLFKAVGYKVAMGNATDLLKSQADEVCDSVDEDGLAKFIEQKTNL
jgi:HAD superfamily hydrolase (TIGR01484 family)